MTYEKACKEQSGTLHLSDLKQLDLHRCRHFVGLWTTAACVNAGCRDESMYRFGMGNGEKFSEHTVTWQTLTIGGGQYGTAALGFAIGRKDITPSFVGDGGHPYDMVVQEAANNMTVLFYSSDDRRAWLLDGSSALLHLARAHLNDDISKYKHTDVLNHLQHMENGGRVKYAADILRANATLKIYLKLESMPEDKIACNEGLARSTIGFRYASTARQKPSSGSSGQQRTAVAWTYQQLVMRLWQRLRQMNECLRKLKQQPPDLSFRFSGPRIIGWEAHDLISFKDSLPPLFARTGRDSKQWLQYSGALGSVVLMARTFGDLVVPESSKMPLCPRMRFVEKGRDLLAVPCNVLEGPARRYLRDRAPEPLTCVQIEKDIFLHAYDPTSGVCCCDDGTLCNPISKLSSRGKPRLHKNEKLTNGDFFLRYPKGAVVIGSSGASKTAQWRSKTLQRMRVSKNIVNPLQEASTISSTSPEIQRIDTGSLEGSGGNSHQKPSGGADMSPTRTRITSFLAPDTRVANAGSPTSFDNFPDDESPRIGDPVALDDRHSGRPNHGQRQAHAGTDVDHDRPRPSTDNGEDGSDDSFFSASDSCQS